MVGITIAPNIGVQGQPVTDSSTMQILDTLRQATSCDVVIIDLEDGQAWWETRLLVLLAGAARLNKPDKVVFVGKDANTDRRFQGWSHAGDLLPRILTAHPQYERSLQAAWAAAGQWNLVEPLDSPTPSAPVVPVPAPPPWLSGRLATGHPWMAFDPATGLHNQLFAEQILSTAASQTYAIYACVAKAVAAGPAVTALTVFSNNGGGSYSAGAGSGRLVTGVGTTVVANGWRPWPMV